MATRRTYVDSGVLLAAFQGDHEAHAAAMDVLDDPDRDLLVSEFVRLETLPKPIYEKRAEETDFYRAVFESAAVNAAWSAEMTDQAMVLASRYGLSAVDAIHVSAALLIAADEIVTSERPTKPFFRVQEIPVVSLRGGAKRL
jgi:predicted nucleic acid-binding protein